MLLDVVTATFPSLGAVAGAAPAGDVLALGPEWLSPEKIITFFGHTALYIVMLIVFVESGLLVGFFLPGDTLLFAAGLFTATNLTGGPAVIQQPIWLVCAGIFVAAFLGDQLGYYIGKKAGPALFKRPDSRLFKQEFVDQAHKFFDAYGGRAIVLARFVPIARTFVPVVAGVGKMPYKHFVRYNIIGAFAWGVGVTLLGYFLGRIEFVRTNIEVMLLLCVFVSIIPILVESRHLIKQKVTALLRRKDAK
ncbi:VTT domain-containing protein [Micrococcales bacterium 31B]|nr:VTT domain-containing protein [Micrococcales bacterium 31B]